MNDYLVAGKELVNNPQRVDFETLKVRLEDLQALDDSPSAVQSIVIVEGLYALYDQEIRDSAIMKVFVDSDADTRLSRWVLRDTKGDESKLGAILECYLTKARPEMNEFILPTKQFADVILPRGSEESGIELISTGVLDRIKEDLYVESAGHHILHSGDSSVVDLRKESFLEQSQRFYDVS
ncbi:putative uridine kinase Das2p [Trichomonascus vanleenenianus]|uniref:putative uridine kinase DAS2 n=1 Tax=Trichomonascus vanleenenianus TaxID=2268995 RepID=UPI003ECA7C3A